MLATVRGPRRMGPYCGPATAHADQRITRAMECSQLLGRKTRGGTGLPRPLSHLISVVSGSAEYRTLLAR
jgi:hypothetical protein